MKEKGKMLICKSAKKMRNPLTIVSEFLTKHLSGSEKMNHENATEKIIFAGDKEREKGTSHQS